MSENSKIEWTDHTFNPWRGCTKVSPGCANCYAETMSGRNPKVLGVWGPRGTRVVAADAMWREPIKWDNKARAAGERHRVFCASLADVFEHADTMPPESVEPIRDARVNLFDLIAGCTSLDWLLLTKRPENIMPVIRQALEDAMRSSRCGIAPMRWMLEEWLHGRPPANVWLGTSVENQKAADERIPHLLKCPATVRFLSCEPLLSAVDFMRAIYPPQTGAREVAGKKVPWSERPAINITGGMDSSEYVRRQRNGDPIIDWVIAGGESGPGARPMHPGWARSLRDQCAAAGVPFFFKQWGNWVPSEEKNRKSYITETDSDRESMPACKPWDDGWFSFNVGKKAAGRELDGVLHDALPIGGGK